jgi:hypothetical protein
MYDLLFIIYYLFRIICMLYYLCYMLYDICYMVYYHPSNYHPNYHASIYTIYTKYTVYTIYTNTLYTYPHIHTHIYRSEVCELPCAGSPGNSPRAVIQLQLPRPLRPRSSHPLSRYHIATRKNHSQGDRSLVIKLSSSLVPVFLHPIYFFSSLFPSFPISLFPYFPFSLFS